MITSESAVGRAIGNLSAIHEEVGKDMLFAHYGIDDEEHAQLAELATEQAFEQIRKSNDHPTRLLINVGSFFLHGVLLGLSLAREFDAQEADGPPPDSGRDEKGGEDDR